MKFLCAFIVLVFVVGVYSNCGCLKCNKHLNVYSPRGSGLKIIYKNPPCGCLTSVPYSVQVPAQPVVLPYRGRSYGYQIQEGTVQDDDDPISSCPIQREYNVQLQVPKSQPPPAYLVGLFAKTDRVLVQGPPEPLPGPGCSRPVLEPVQVVNDPDGDFPDSNIWCYEHNRPGCSCCLRYDRKIPIVPPKITINPSLLNLQLLQKHSYTPPKTHRNIFNLGKTKPGILNSQGENFYRIPISDLFKKSKTIQNEEVLKSEKVNSGTGKESFGINPGIVRIYRQTFLKPSQKNSVLPYRFKIDQRSDQNKFSSPKTYQQVFLKPQPKRFWVKPDLERKSENFDVHKSPNQHGPNMRNTRKNVLADRKVQKFPELNSNYPNLGNDYQNTNTRLPNDVYPGIILLRNAFPGHVRHNTGPTLGAQIPGSLNINKRLKNISPNFNYNSKNGEISETMQKVSPNPFISPFQEGKQKFQDSNKMLNDVKVPGDGQITRDHQNSNTKPKNTQPEKLSKQVSAQNQFEPFLNNKQVQNSNAPGNLEQNLSNNQNYDLPKNIHVRNSQQMLLTEGDSGAKTFFLSSTNQFTASDSVLGETLDSILSKNRAKRSINMKLLALKPENPPRFLRTHNPSQWGYSNYRNEEQISARRPSLRERLKGLQHHGINPSEYGRHHAIHAVNPSLCGPNGRHLPYGVNPSVHGGRSSIHDINPLLYGGRFSSPVRRPLDDNIRLSRYPRENKRKKKVQPKKKKNLKLKSNWKRTNKIIKDWFLKGSPLSAPEIQLPSFESSKLKKPFRRYKRRIRDEDFIFPDEKKRLGRRKPFREDKREPQVETTKPEGFLEPLNFDNIFHPTPILHLLNSPIRFLNHFHKLKTHVSPVVGTIPKVIQVSRRYVIGLLKNFGRDAIHLGSHFLKGFTNLKKSKLLPRRRFRRAPEDDLGIEVGIGDEEMKSDGDVERVNLGEGGWNQESDGKGNLEGFDEELEDEEEFADITLDKLMAQKEFQNILAMLADSEKQESSFNATRKKRDVDGPNENILMGLFNILLGLGGNISENKGPRPQNQSPQSEGVDGGKRQKEDVDVPQKDAQEQDSSNMVIEERRKRDIEEVLAELESSGHDFDGLANIWKVLDHSGHEKAPPDHEDADPNNPKMESSRKKREAQNNPSLVSNVGETKSVKGLLDQPKPKPTAEFDVEVQTIQDQIAQISTNIQTLQNYDFSQNLDIYQGLLKLQNIKTDIVQKWKGLIVQVRPQNILGKKELLGELKEAQDLKTLIFQEILQRIDKQNSIFRGNWIKILVRLQKLHCVVKSLSQKVDDENFHINFLENLDLVTSNNQQEFLESSKRDQEVKLEAQITLAENLKQILNQQDGEKIKEEAKIIWEINNVEKLQKISILELNQKISHGLKIRKELKILFDLQKQLEECKEKQKVLMADLGKKLE